VRRPDDASVDAGRGRVVLMHVAGAGKRENGQSESSTARGAKGNRVL
jgi:hypothetical protein